MPDHPTKNVRFGEWSKFVPVAFVTFAICTLYLIFLFCSCLPGLISGKHRTYELVKVIVFHFITALLIVCYLRSILTHPGQIPDKDPQWEYMPHDARRSQAQDPLLAADLLNLQEKKRSGNRRNCKWCNKYKPDRTHHCRICRMCILKMDHHCPWIYNCVGFGNYKYFLLLLFYVVLDLWFVVANLSSSVRLCVQNPDTPFVHMFLCLFGWTLATFLGILSALFFGFHVWLSTKAMTTVEFCEKHLPKKKTNADGKHSYDNSVYNLGLCGNLRATLGESPFCWLLPCCPPVGTGLDFLSADTRLTMDFEASRSVRRAGHKIVQRPAKAWEPSPTGEDPHDANLNDSLTAYGALLSIGPRGGTGGDQLETGAN